MGYTTPDTDKLKPAVYFAMYLVDPNDGKAAVEQLKDEVLTSFGCGDEQWSALLASDDGAQVTLVEGALNFGLSLIVVTCPVDAPRDYWLSPCLLDCQTFSERGDKELRGEPLQWELRDPDGEPFVQPDKPYYDEDEDREDARAYLQDRAADRAYLYDNREED